MKSEPIITLDRIQCSFTMKKGLFGFKNYTALKDISFDIYKGETLGIIGRNGAGKSTLLKIISGILLPDDGEVIYHNNDLSISLLNLATGFSPDLPGRMNAILSAMFLGFSRKEAESRIDEIIAYAELEDWIDEPLKTYSTGMQMRLGFAVAIKMSPDILLIDEVLGVGDLEFKKKSVTTMKEKMMSDQTVVFVSHAIPHVRELCSRVIWIEEGVIKMSGNTDQVLEKYLGQPSKNN